MNTEISLDWPLDPRSPGAPPGLHQVLADLTDAATRLESLWATVGEQGVPVMHLENACAAVQLALVELRRCVDPEGATQCLSSN